MEMNISTQVSLQNRCQSILYEFTKHYANGLMSMDDIPEDATTTITVSSSVASMFDSIVQEDSFFSNSVMLVLWHSLAELTR